MVKTIRRKNWKTPLLSNVCIIYFEHNIIWKFPRTFYIFVTTCIKQIDYASVYPSLNNIKTIIKYILLVYSTNAAMSDFDYYDTVNKFHNLG